MQVGIQGLSASYSEAALREYWPHAKVHLYESFLEVFAALKVGTLDYAFLPFENSTAGFIQENFRLLDEFGFLAEGEHIFRVEHCLLVPDGTSRSEIREVYSHPQALMQCQAFIKANGWQAVPWFDTAGAARDIAGKKGAAAIASFGAAHSYGLQVIDKAINDAKDNWTRFFVVGKSLAAARVANLFRIQATDFGSLIKAGWPINALHSLPETSLAWQHRYYFEVYGIEASEIDQRLKMLASLKVLGSFSSALKGRN